MSIGNTAKIVRTKEDTHKGNILMLQNFESIEDNNYLTNENSLRRIFLYHRY